MKTKKKKAAAVQKKDPLYFEKRNETFKIVKNKLVELAAFYDFRGCLILETPGGKKYG